MEFVFAAWLFSAIACAIIANAKGRSIVNWFFLGLFFGFFAFLFVAFSSSKNDSRQNSEPSLAYDKETGLLVVAPPKIPSSLVKVCPFCAEEIKKEAIKCKHCGSNIPADLG